MQIILIYVLRIMNDILSIKCYLIYQGLSKCYYFLIKLIKIRFMLLMVTKIKEEQVMTNQGSVGFGNISFKECGLVNF